MVNPADGLLGSSQFLPSIATVKKWLDERGPKQPSRLPEHRLLPPPKDGPEDSPEVKEAAIARWKEKRKKLVKNFHGEPERPSRLVWKQYHDPQALLRALDMWTPEKRQQFDQALEDAA